MQVAELVVHIIRVPLRREIAHASHARTDSENLIVRCRLADGSEGWGEGVPRSYVTGETPDGALAQLSRTQLSVQLAHVCDSWDDVIALCEGFRPEVGADDPRGCGANALRCAVQIAILDAFGRLFGEPVSRVVSHYAPATPIRMPQDRVRYSAAITAERPWPERFAAAKIRAWGFAHCKVKVGVTGVDDAARLAVIRRWLGPAIDIRVDANEAWNLTVARKTIARLLRHRISAVEQPLPHAEVAAHAELRRELGCPIMLDESLTGPVDAAAAIRDGTCDIFNIRLSKCGGFLASLRLAAFACEHGLGFQLGCHPGETGILSAAGRHWATAISGARWLEGSYDRHILAELPTREDVTFGYGGWAPALDGPGLGVTVDPAVLARITTRVETFRIS